MQPVCAELTHLQHIACTLRRPLQPFMWLMTTEVTLHTGLKVTGLQASTTKYSSNWATQVNKSKHTIINYLDKQAHKQHIRMSLNLAWIVFIYSKI